MIIQQRLQEMATGAARQIERTIMPKMEATIEPRVEPVRQRLHSQVTYHFDVKSP